MTSCHQAVSPRKQLARNIHFKALGFGSIFSTRLEQVDADTKSFRLQEMKMAHRKLYAITENGLGDP